MSLTSYIGTERNILAETRSTPHAQAAAAHLTQSLTWKSCAACRRAIFSRPRCRCCFATDEGAKGRSGR